MVNVLLILGEAVSAALSIAVVYLFLKTYQPQHSVFLSGLPIDFYLTKKGQHN